MVYELKRPPKISIELDRSDYSLINSITVWVDAGDPNDPAVTIRDHGQQIPVPQNKMSMTLQDLLDQASSIIGGRLA